MRVLFDQATPVPIRPFLEGHTVSTAAHEGWDRLQNGELLNAAEAAGFDVLLTTDKNIRHQQNLAGRKISIIVLGRQQWPEVRPHVHLVIAAVDAAKAGTYVEVEIPEREESAKGVVSQFEIGISRPAPHGAQPGSPCANLVARNVKTIRAAIPEKAIQGLAQLYRA
jgi:hypothetical protein